MNFSDPALSDTLCAVSLQRVNCLKLPSSSLKNAFEVEYLWAIPGSPENSFYFICQNAEIPRAVILAAAGL